MDKHDIVYKNMAEADKASKATGTLVGRYIRESIADGYAYYTVEAIHDKTILGYDTMVQVKHVPYLDGYRVPMIESMGCLIPLKYVRENIARRDHLDTLFASRR